MFFQYVSLIPRGFPSIYSSLLLLEKKIFRDSYNMYICYSLLMFYESFNFHNDPNKYLLLLKMGNPNLPHKTHLVK